MRASWIWLALVAVVVLAAGGLVVGRHHHAPAHATAPPRPLDAIVADYRRAHAAAAAALRPSAERAARRGTPVWHAARSCLGDWRAAPEERKATLLDLYGVAAAQPTLPAEIAAGRSWLTTLQAIPDLDRAPDLSTARHHIATALHALTTLHNTVLDLCAIVQDWGRAGWARKPPALRQLQLALHELSSAHHGTPLIDLGIPDALNRCEPVFETLAPEDSFCG